VHLYRCFVSQSSEFCRHNPLCCFSTSVYCCKRIFRYLLSPETFGYTLVYIYIWNINKFYYFSALYFYGRNLPQTGTSAVLSCICVIFQTTIIQNLFLENLKGRDHLEDLSVYRVIILEWIFEKLGGRRGSDSSLRIGTSGGLLWTRQRRGISWLAERLLASQVFHVVS
jgi:hypothetical protein